jgi:hypothetical protein
VNHERAENLERLLRSGLITPRDYRMQFDALISEAQPECKQPCERDDCWLHERCMHPAAA